MSRDLTISSVAKAFGRVKALRDVSLTVRAGEFVSLLGPSGCGKTTLLRIVAGFETPDAGEVRLGEERLDVLPPFRRPVGMVFQNLALFPHLTVANNVGFGLAVRREESAAARRKIGEALALVDLAGYEDRRIHQLSGGQRQRVALARALITEPDLLLLDEPLSALDLKLRRQLQGELKRLQRRTGTTFVFVTHDQEEAMAMSDRVAVFYQGAIEQMGAPQEIYRRPATRFVAEFVGETNILAAERRDGHIVLTELGIAVAAPSGFPDAGSFLLSVRPESVALLPDGASGGIAGQVVETEFSGMTMRFSATIAGRDSPIRVALPSERCGALAIGAQVRLGFDLAASSALPG